MTTSWVILAFTLLGAIVLASLLCLNRRRRGPRELADLVRMVGALRLSTDAVCLLDAQGRIRWANSTYLELTGYARDKLLGQSLSELLHQRVEDEGKVRAFDSALQDARELRIDLQYQPRDGAAYWTVIELHPIREPDHLRVIGHVVVQINIDNQRQERLVTLQALRDRQAVLDILDKHALVTETDLRGTITRVNARFVHISGYSKAELLGRKHSIVSSGKHDSAFWSTIWHTISNGHIWHGEICNRAKDGSLYWVDSVIAPMLGTDGKPQRYVSIRTDITALKRSRDMLSRTGNVAGIGGWYCNLQTRSLYFTDAACRILCLGTNTMPAQDILLQILPRDLGRALLDGVREVSTTGAASCPGQRTPAAFLHRRAGRILCIVRQ